MKKEESPINNYYIYIDESGDLGFSNLRKSSQYFSIGLLLIKTENVKQLSYAVKKTLRKKVNHKKNHLQNEIKGSKTTLNAKKYLYDQIAALNFSIYLISIDKKSFKETIQEKININKIYNKLTAKLLSSLPQEENMTLNLVIDKRDTLETRNHFDLYIKTHLDEHLPYNTKIFIYHRQSESSPGLQIVDLFTWGANRYLSHNENEWVSYYSDKIKNFGRVKKEKFEVQPVDVNP